MTQADQSQLPFPVIELGFGGAGLNSEAEILFVALSLLGSTHDLTTEETRLASRLTDQTAFTSENLALIKKEMRNGNDPLGEAFLQIRSPLERRPLGAVYTPKRIVESMIDWTVSSKKQPARIIDVGAGSGRFIMEAAKCFPQAELHAVEIDPLASIVLRANARVRNFDSRLTVHTGDYCDVELPKIDQTTLFIGNPPYVRHHSISAGRKAWLAETSAKYGLKASRLAGLHLYFYLKTLELSQEQDFGVFITAAEWMDVNYGQLLRSLLVDHLGVSVIHLLDPEIAAFENATTTAAVVGFNLGSPTNTVRVSMVKDATRIRLTRGKTICREELRRAHRWSPTVRGDKPEGFEHIELGELFRVHRGQVTGANNTWIYDKDTPTVPEEYLFPTVTRARELFDAQGFLQDESKLRRVVDLPVDLDAVEPDKRRLVDEFLAWAEQQGADSGYVARNRPAWWAVGLKPPPPIVCTYMARRPPAFVFNCCAARLLNIAHGLYPREEIAEETLKRLMLWLNNSLGIEGGRAYAGGLIKFEPREIQRIKIPSLDILYDATHEMVARSA